MRKVCIVLTCLIHFSSVAQALEATDFSAETIKPLIQKTSTFWSKAIKNKDVSILNLVYDDHAHYLPNDADAIHGKEGILAYWAASFAFMTDLYLEMETLEGTKELLYETGTGRAGILSEDGSTLELPFKYVNVWKLQPDGTYRVVIDTFNNPVKD